MLLVNAVIVGASFMAYSLFRTSWPHWAMMMVLGVGGFFRSLQFTSLNGMAYADIEQDQMSRAATTSRSRTTWTSCSAHSWTSYWVESPSQAIEVTTPRR